MVEIIEREKRWDGRVEFTREALREKVARELDGRDRLAGPLPGATDPKSEKRR